MSTFPQLGYIHWKRPFPLRGEGVRVVEESDATVGVGEERGRCGLRLFDKFTTVTALTPDAFLVG